MKEFGTAAILCGGKSKRMGFDKSLIKVDNKFLIEIIGEELEKAFEDVILISKERDKFSHIEYNVFSDEVSGAGPIGAIYTALTEASSQYVFITACDMPFVNLRYIEFMKDIVKKYKVEGTASYCSGYVEPLYAFYSKDMLGAFKKELSNYNFKLNDVLKNSNIYYIEEKKAREFSKTLKMFTNLNYISDLNILGSGFLED